MPDTTIGGLGSAGTLVGTEKVEVETVAPASARTTTQDIANLAPFKNRTTRAEASGAWSPILADQSAVVRDNNGSDVNITVPTNASVAYPVGTLLMLSAVNTGLPTVVAAGGVTITFPLAKTPRFARRGSIVFLLKTATDTWDAYGEFQDQGYIRINNQVGTTYTYALSDAGGIVRASNAGAIAHTIPTNAAIPFEIGATISIRQVLGGKVTISPDTGVTLNPRSGSPNATAVQGSVVMIHKVGTNEWDIAGDLEA